MNLCLFFPPLLGAISGALIIFLLSFIIKKYFKIDENELEEDLKSLIDKHLDDLVGAFGRQIPMSSLFLTGSLASKLKLQAREEILKMTPSLKQKLLGRVAQKIKANHYFFKALALGSGIGLIVGSLQSLILFLLGYR